MASDKKDDKFISRGEQQRQDYFPWESVTQWDSKKQKYVHDNARCATCEHRLKTTEYGVCKNCLDKATNGHPVAPETE